MPTSFGGNLVEYSKTEIGELVNVDVTGAQHGDILRYDAIIGKWVHTSNHTQADPQLIDTAGDVVYTVELFSGVIMRDCNGAIRTDTLDSADNIVNRLVGPKLVTGNTFRIMVFNFGSETLTIAAGTGVIIYGNATITTGVGQEYLVVILDDTESSESVGFYAV